MLVAPLPPLSTADRALFTAFAALRLDIQALARETRRDLTDLIAWASSPSIDPWIERFNDLSRLAAGRLRSLALTALAHTLETTNDPIEKRRAATAILRACSARLGAEATRLRPNASRAIASPSSDFDAPSPLGGPDLRAGSDPFLGRSALRADSEPVLATLRAGPSPHPHPSWEVPSPRGGGGYSPSSPLSSPSSEGVSGEPRGSPALAIPSFPSHLSAATHPLDHSATGPLGHSPASPAARLSRAAGTTGPAP